MPQAGRSRRRLLLWAPHPASSSAPVPSDNADIPLEDKLEPSASPCPCTTTPEKTLGLSDDDDDEDEHEEHGGQQLSVRNSKVRQKRSDFYRRYSAHWQFGYAEYIEDSIHTGWANSTGEGLSCSDNTGRPCEQDEGDNDLEQGNNDEDCLESSRRMASWAGQPDIKGRNETVRMMLLCAVHFGITFTWGVEMTYCTPYLLNLGLTKSQTSLVWIAGPLSGLIVQPIVGAMADSSTSRWGRRRPYIAVGSGIVAASLITLGWTKEIAALLMPTDTDFAKKFIIFLAVLALYVTDFAINAVMSTSRSLIVDTLPISKQQTGAAWAGRMGSLGHIIGYGLGAVDLPGTFGTLLGDTQFKQLTVVAALGILGTSGITCWAVTERVLISSRHDPRSRQQQGNGTMKVLRRIWSTLLDLPPRIQGICWAVFWGWIGWFPFNVYSSTWVGETYFRYDAKQSTASTTDALGDMGRIGSYTLSIYSLMTFTGAWVLPLLVRAPEDEGFTARPPQSIAHLVEGLEKVKPDLLTVWIIGNLLFAGTMFWAPFATSFRFATALVVICGIPWSIFTWAPVAMMGVEVNKISGSGMADPYRRLSDPLNTDNDDVSPIELQRTDSLQLEHGVDAPIASGTTGELSGIYFGIYNIYQTIPQFIGTFISTIVFAVLEPGKSPELATDAHPSEHASTDGPNAIAVCLFIGSIAACVAAYVTRKLKHL